MSEIGGYTINGLIGEGGMGVVYRCFDPAIQREVAIKVIRFQPGGSTGLDELRARFSREATAAGRLSHPNVVTVYQFGEDHEAQYLVMELVNGRALDRLLSRGRLDFRIALRLLSQIAAGLDHAHTNGVFHRDVKPGNILVRPDGVVKITDFGIAKIKSHAITQRGLTLGTPAYMAPEAITGGTVDARSDQFSLAVIAFEMLTGQRPFQASTGHDLMKAIASEEPPRLSQAEPALPAAGDAVMSRALSKNPAGRYPTCSDFVDGLAAAILPPAGGAPVYHSSGAFQSMGLPASTAAAAPLIEPSSPVSVIGEPVVPAPALSPAEPAAPKRSRVLFAVVPVALVAAGLVIWLIAPRSAAPGEVAGSRSGETAPPPTPSPQAGDTSSTVPVVTAQPAPQSDRLNGLRWEFVAIPPGEFAMGSENGHGDEKPVHHVVVTKPFEMGKHELTQAQWQSVMGNNPSRFPGSDLPVEQVSWDDVQAFIRKLNELSDGYVYRLPTEAEWEYAAGAGSSGDPADLSLVAWLDTNAGGRTQPVGRKQANAWGLHDMLGNVWEWCSDWFDEHYYQVSPASDPQGPPIGKTRVVRGGSWMVNAFFTRIAERNNIEPGGRYYNIGFRVVREARSGAR